MNSPFNALFDDLTATQASPPSRSPSRPAARGTGSPWQYLDMHWHGYQGKGPGPNEPARARRTRLTTAPGTLLRSPAEAGRWIATAVLHKRGLLARWDPLTGRFMPMCRNDRFTFIRDRVVDLTSTGRSLYMALLAPNRNVILAVEAVTRVECPVSGCPLAGPLRRRPDRAIGTEPATTRARS